MEQQYEAHNFHCGRCGFSEATIDGSDCNHCSHLPECLNCEGIWNEESEVCYRCGVGEGDYQK